jgi:hypothetical protein
MLRSAETPRRNIIPWETGPLPHNARQFIRTASRCQRYFLRRVPPYQGGRFRELFGGARGYPGKLRGPARQRYRSDKASRTGEARQKNRRCGEPLSSSPHLLAKARLGFRPVLTRLSLFMTNSLATLRWTRCRSSHWRHRAYLSRGIFRPGSSSFSLSRCSSSPWSGDLGVVSGGFRLYGGGLCPFKRGFGLISVHFGLINPFPAAAGASQHQGKDREERDCKASFQ